MTTTLSLLNFLLSFRVSCLTQSLINNQIQDQLLFVRFMQKSILFSFHITFLFDRFQALIYLFPDASYHTVSEARRF